MNAAPHPTDSPAPGHRVTTAHLMAAVGLVAVGFAVLGNVPLDGLKDWRQRVLAVHVVTLGFLIPLVTALVYLGYAAHIADPGRRSERTQLTFAVGGILATLALGSLLFWVIVMCLVSE